VANSKRKCRNCPEYFRVDADTPKYVKWCCEGCREALALKALAKVRLQQERARKRSQSAEKANNRKRKREFYENDITTRRKAADRWCNRYVVLRDTGKPCISCGAKWGTVKFSAGHLITAGSCTALRYDPDNIHGQCWFNCNKNRSGNISEYRKGMLVRHGEKKGKEILEKLDGPQPIIKITVDFYREVEIKYKAKCKDLESQV